MFVGVVGAALHVRLPKPATTPLHRIHAADTTDLRELVADRYADRPGFRCTEIERDGLTGLLVTGTITPGPADWCGPLAEVTGQPIAEENRTAMGLLLVRGQRSTYALTYGAGHMMIDPARLDPAFGVGIALRLLDEERLTPIRRHVRDTLMSSATKPVRYGAVVGQVAARLSGVRLTYSPDVLRAAMVADAGRTLSLHRHPRTDQLLDDLRRIERVSTRPDPLPELASLAENAH